MGITRVQLSDSYMNSHQCSNHIAAYNGGSWENSNIIRLCGRNCAFINKTCFHITCNFSATREKILIMVNLKKNQYLSTPIIFEKGEHLSLILKNNCIELKFPYYTIPYFT